MAATLRDNEVYFKPLDSQEARSIDWRSMSHYISDGQPYAGTSSCGFDCIDVHAGRHTSQAVEDWIKDLFRSSNINYSIENFTNTAGYKDSIFLDNLGYFAEKGSLVFHGAANSYQCDNVILSQFSGTTFTNDWAIGSNMNNETSQPDATILNCYDQNDISSKVQILISYYTPDKEDDYFGYKILN